MPHKLSTHAAISLIEYSLLYVLAIQYTIFKLKDFLPIDENLSFKPINLINLNNSKIILISFCLSEFYNYFLIYFNRKLNFSAIKGPSLKEHNYVKDTTIRA